MCGFAGYFSRAQTSLSEMQHVLSNMGEKLSHRGPDDSGIWVDEHQQFGVVHQRLAIVDLSSAGHQPMTSFSGRYVIAYNGEIYNYLELKNNLAGSGCCFKGHSDTEVLLAAIETWGIEQSLQKIRGMFAFVLWDKQTREMILARDRIGEKPLYYGSVNNTFYFGSELKAFYVHPQWKGEINKQALLQYVQFNYIPAPYSIFQNINKLQPGHYLQVSADKSEIKITDSLYWTINDHIGEKSLVEDKQLALDKFDYLLHESVKEKMVADVPVGAFLSGGVDSSLVAAHMQACSSRPVNTFTIGFHEKSHNEAIYAKQVADYLGTSHTELYLSADDTLGVISDVPKIYDEPFADFSQLPTYIISKLARESVTVCLSGDGGDELFGGYTRYQLADRTWNKLAKLPLVMRKFSGGMIKKTPDVVLDGAFGVLESWFARYGKRGRVSDKIKKSAQLLEAKDQYELYRLLMSMNNNPHGVVNDDLSVINGWGDLVSDELSYLQWMSLIDQKYYLPDDILVKVDRASMAVSLESRIPLLDHRLVELSWKLSDQVKISNGTGKWLLKQSLRKYLPDELIDRPKMGFSVPIANWLRSDLKEWAGDLLNQDRLSREGFFHAEAVQAKWNEHLSGKRNWQYQLWNILMFQAWLDEYDVLPS